jgi:hypothetical protein
MSARLLYYGKAMRAFSRFAAGLVLVMQAAPVAADPQAAKPPGEPTLAVRFFNPVVHVDEFLRLPGVARYVAGFAKTPSDGSSSLTKLRTMLAVARPFWPTEIGLRLLDTGLADGDALFRLLMLSSLGEGAQQAGKAGRQELPRLQQAILVELRRLHVPGAAVWADFADAAAASRLQELVWGWLQQTLATLPVRVLREKDALGVRTTLGSIFKPVELKDMLIEMGWLSGRKDRQARAIVAAAAAVPVEAWLDVRGKRMRLSLGPRLPEQDAPVASPPTGIKPAELVATGQWESSAFKNYARGWAALWQTWQDTAAGRAAKAADDEDFLGTPAQIVRELERTSDRGRAWLWTERGLHALFEEQPGRPTSPLAADPILALLPATAVAVDVDARESLGEQLSESLSRIEDRMGLRALVELLKTGETATPVQKMQAKYYEHAAGLRELIHVGWPAQFEGAGAFVVGAGARVKWAKVEDAGKPPRTGRNLPVPELAWIGRAKDVDAAVRLVGQTWTALASAVAKGRPMPTAPALVPAPAPVPGAKAFWLDTGWMEGLTITKVSGEGGFKPNVAVHGNFFVLSTSPDLSRRILATPSLPAKQRMQKPATAKPLLAWSNYPCTGLVKQLRDGLQTLDRLFDLHDIIPKFDMVVSPVCNLVSGLTFTAEQDGDLVVSRYHLPAAPSLY